MILHEGFYYLIQTYIKQQKIITFVYNSPVGELLLGSLDKKLCVCDWVFRTKRKEIDKRICNALDAIFEVGTSEVIKKTVEQLAEYFNGERKVFDIPLLLVGTPFQKTVWEELIKTPFGEKISYSVLSKRLKNEGAIRAVAAANGANAISIIVPCHRIVGKNGDLVGYAGGLPAKKKLLHLEGSISQLSLF